ncbi:hypothetical protein ASD31_15470 [Rhizobium sp. Root482]|nr:hypothetical protein ASD31_15470 [Rhizobium sp. Root482]
MLDHRYLMKTTVHQSEPNSGRKNWQLSKACFLEAGAARERWQRVNGGVTPQNPHLIPRQQLDRTIMRQIEQCVDYRVLIEPGADQRHADLI